MKIECTVEEFQSLFFINKKVPTKKFADTQVITCDQLKSQ